MAPTTRSTTRDREQGVQTPSSHTQIINSAETMSENQSEAQQLADAREQAQEHAQQIADAHDQIRLLQEQLDRAQSASLRNTPSLDEPAKSQTVKLADPNPLTDGVSPTYENWRIQIEDKFIVNKQMFDSEQAKMAYIFNRTGGIAQEHLAPRYRKGPEPFTTSTEMITYLAEIFENPFEAQDARIDFRKMTMKEDESFSDFYTRFLRLTGMGKIPTDDLQPDLYDKLTPALQQSVLPFLDTLLTSKALAHKCLLIDKNLRRLQQRRVQLRTTRLPSRSVTALSPPRGPISSPAAYPTIRATSPNPALKLYGPSRESTPARKDREVICYNCKQSGHITL